MLIRSTLRIALFVAMCVSTGCAASVNQWVVEKFPALTQRPEPAEALKQLKKPCGTLLSAARFHEQVGNFSGARQAYDLLLTENSKSTEAILGLARLDQMAGRTSEAEQAYLKALKQNPNDPHVLDVAGQFYLTQKRWDTAQKLLNRAMLAAPEDKLIRHHLAVALARSGDTEAALSHFVRAIGDAEAHYNMALILHEQGEVEQSEQHLLQAVIKKPEFQEAQNWLDEIRRERKAQQLLAGGYPSGSRIEGRRTSAIQQTSHLAATRASHGVISTSTQRHAPGTSVPNRASGTSSLTAVSNLTSEQLEQQRNQMGVN